jgi:membrane protease YdiL (CAAX protease family)
MLVSNWTVTDVIAVALLSGLAEEALLRAFLQPLLGLFPAAVIFALLHVLPDRRLWFWPVMALVIGVCLGYIYEAQGFPAVAAAHIVLNGVGLMRLQRIAAESRSIR